MESQLNFPLTYVHLYIIYVFTYVCLNVFCYYFCSMYRKSFGDSPVVWTAIVLCTGIYMLIYINTWIYGISISEFFYFV